MKKLTPIFLSILALSILSCARNADYQYYSTPVPPGQKFSMTQKVKDILGNADVDILTVIDNSGSMSIYQNYLSANTDLFIDTLTKGTSLHWKMGLISTSLSESPYLGFAQGDEVTYVDNQAAKKFKAAVAKLGTSGDSTERTYEPILKALNAYPNFLRTQADFVILLVSDAPEQSYTTTQDFVDQMTKIKGGDINKLSFYGTLDPVEWCPPTDDTFHWSGNKFEQLLKLIKGAAYPICDKNFGKNMADIANRVVKNATTPRIYLQARPKIETLDVVFHGNSLPKGPKEKGGLWVYNFRQNAVIFHDLAFAAGDLEEVQVNYQEDVSSQ